jgi:ribosomal protein S12 methylthiotransferase
MQRKKHKVTVGFISLGCPKNSVDSERMLAEIAQAGYLITAQPETADIILINTCAFIAPAIAESLEAIRYAVKQKLSGPVKKVIVAGCLPEREGKNLFEKVKGIDAVIGLGQRDNIAGIIRTTLSRKGSSAYLHPSQQVIHDDRTRLLITPGHWAYLRIAEGCSRQCSFCTIPAIRGRFRSKPPQLVLAEADELVSAGAVELNIIAQDTTSYGRDLKIQNALTSLIDELEKITGLSWIRLMYLYPAAIDDRLIDTVAQSKKVVRYMDVPIQHVSNNILKAMHRPDSKDRLYQLIEKLRNAIPDVVLRTTMIVGFPGESDRRFSELMDFVNWARFDALGCFQFYPEPGTSAARLPDQVPQSVKQQRIDQLMLAQQKIAFGKNKKRIGTDLTCLVDSIETKNKGRGRYYGQAPEIDSICIINNCSAQPGRFINAKVTDTSDYDLIVEQTQILS